MPSEKERGALTDMLRHIELAEGFGFGLDDQGLGVNLQALYATIRSLEVISEASRRLSDELKARHPSIPWRDMAAAGNFYTTMKMSRRSESGRHCGRTCLRFEWRSRKNSRGESVRIQHFSPPAGEPSNDKGHHRYRRVARHFVHDRIIVGKGGHASLKRMRLI